MMSLDDIARNATQNGYSEVVLNGRLVSAALRLRKGVNTLTWSIDGRRVSLDVLRFIEAGGFESVQQTLFDLPGLPLSDDKSGGSPLSTLIRVPPIFVPSVNRAYAQFISESGESISFADFLGLVLIAGLEGFGDD